MAKYFLTYHFIDRVYPKKVRVEADTMLDAVNKMEKVARKIFTPAEYRDISNCIAEKEEDPNKLPTKFNLTPEMYKNPDKGGIDFDPIRLDDVPF